MSNLLLWSVSSRRSSCRFAVPHLRVHLAEWHLPGPADVLSLPLFSARYTLGCRRTALTLELHMAGYLPLSAKHDQLS